MKDRICAIHQPNFFPWLGYFDKIRKCDKFIVLDDVQFERKNAGTWMNRVAINISGSKKWLTAPIIRPGGLFKVNEVLSQETKWRDKIKKTIQTNYGKSEFFKEYHDIIFSLIDFPSNKLFEYNINVISTICNILNIEFKKKSVLSSSLGITTTSTQRLIDLSKTVDCNAYMAGGGAEGYQKDEHFIKQGVSLLYQNFVHPIYSQKSREFIPGLSILDALFNMGAESTRMMTEPTATYG